MSDTPNLDRIDAIRREEILRLYAEIDRMTNALKLIASQSDEALILAGKNDPLWAKRVAIANLPK